MDRQPPATTNSEADTVVDDVGHSLALLEASRDRIYHDADGDAAARSNFYATLDPDEPPEELIHALATLLEASHRPRPAYKPYGWHLRIRSPPLGARVRTPVGQKYG